jgi:hypothetical protein
MNFDPLLTHFDALSETGSLVAVAVAVAAPSPPTLPRDVDVARGVVVAVLVLARGADAGEIRQQRLGVEGPYERTSGWS